MFYFSSCTKFITTNIHRLTSDCSSHYQRMSTRHHLRVIEYQKDKNEWNKYNWKPFRSKGIRSLLIAAQLGICPGENDVGMVVVELLRGRSIEIYLLDGRKSFIERMRPNTSGNSSSNIRVCTGSHSSRVVTPNKCSTLRSSLFLHCSTRDIALQENTGF